MDDDINGPTLMIPYSAVMLLISVINFVVTFVLYIPVTKTIYKRLSPSRRNRANDGDVNKTSEDTELQCGGQNDEESASGCWESASGC